MIKSFRAVGLNDTLTFSTLHFHADLNIITGKNGSGKTRGVKAIWYILSANIEWLMPELRFKELELETDRFHLLATLDDSNSVTRRGINWRITPTGTAKAETFKTYTTRLSPETSDPRTDKLNNRLLQLSSSPSLFFPTFRRIEGGFGMAQRRSDVRSFVSSSTVEGSLSALSNRLSVGRHRFVAAMSTADIVSNLTERYADVSERVNSANKALSGEIIESIRKYEETPQPASPEPAPEQLDRATDILESIRERIKQHSALQEELLRPFAKLSELIAVVFQHKGIRLTRALTLGDAAGGAIESDLLSSGEKQMLSFLAYNAFESGGIIFIDEPEISLHVDWQRILFPTLIAQGGSNQFVITTHSPFIYAKFADKELVLDSNRGDTEGSDADVLADI